MTINQKRELREPTRVIAPRVQFYVKFKVGPKFLVLCHQWAWGMQVSTRLRVVAKFT